MNCPNKCGGFKDKDKKHVPNSDKVIICDTKEHKDRLAHLKWNHFIYECRKCGGHFHFTPAHLVVEDNRI